MEDSTNQDEYAKVAEMREEMRGRQTRKEFFSILSYGCLAVIGGAASFVQAAGVSVVMAQLGMPLVIAGAVACAAVGAIGGICAMMSWRENAEINMLSEEINSSLNAQKIGKEIGKQLEGVLQIKDVQKEKAAPLPNYPQNQRADGKPWAEVTAQQPIKQRVMS